MSNVTYYIVIFSITELLPLLVRFLPLISVPEFRENIVYCHYPLITTQGEHLGPVARSLVSANRWLRGIKMYRFPWYLTLVSTNHASSNPGQLCSLIFQDLPGAKQQQQ